MSPVSDTQAWDTRTPQQQAADNTRLARAYLGRLVQQLKGDELERWRQRLLSFVGELDKLNDLVQDGAVEVVPAPASQVPVPLRRAEPAPAPTPAAADESGARHRMGEDTRAFMAGHRPMRRNGRWGSR